MNINGMFFVLTTTLVLAGCASSSKCSSAQYQPETRFTVCSDENELVGMLYMPENLHDGEKIPLVITMHGTAENRDAPIEKAVSDALVKAGVATIRFDFAAHGESSGKDYEVTTSRQIEEGREIYDYAKKLPFVSEIILFGHSQGGLVAGLLAADLGSDKVPLLVQVAASATVKDTANTGKFGNVKAFDPNNIPEKIPLGKTGFTLGRDFFEDAKTLPIYEKAETYRGKVLLVHGEEDKTVPPESSRRYAEAYKAHADCKLVFVPGEPHQFVNDRAGLASRVVSFVSECTK